MTTTKHTPGPWLIGRDPKGNPHNPPTIWSGGENGFSPAAFRVADVEGDAGSSDEDAANAHLIAAAPDLLAACEAMIFQTEWRDGKAACSLCGGVATHTDKCAVTITRAAIAKARGGA